jgi:uncharacterized RDD family membrane protein YckC
MMKNKIDSASHNVTPVWRRIKASLIDYLVILAWMAIIGLVGLTLSLITGGYPDYLGTFGPVGAQIIFFFVLTFPVGIYLYVSEVGTRQATIGKIKVGMRVVTLEGGAPSKISILMRTIVKLLPWEIAHTFIWQMQYVFYQSGYEADVPIWIFAGLNVSMILVIIYVAMIALRQDGRAPHDLVAGTRVDLR